MESELLVVHARILSQNAQRNVIEDGALAVSGGKIIAVAPTSDVEKNYHSANTWDAKRKLVIPGLINTHNHLFQTFMRGLGKDLPFMDWIAQSVRKLLPHLDEEALYLAAMLGCLEAIRTGTTTLVDFMYANVKPNFADAVIQAFDDIGIRGVLARGINNQEIIYGTNLRSTVYEPVELSLAQMDRLQSRYHNHPRISFMLAPNAVWIMTPEGLTALTNYAQTHHLTVTMHLLETTLDDEFCMGKYGKRALPFLADHGSLDSSFLAVHAIRLKEEDIALIERHQVKVSHNPVSNMILGTGVCPTPELMRRRIAVGLGTDGAASNDSQNMIETMKAAAILQKVHHRDAAALAAQAVFSMATDQGARVISMDDRIGSLEPGKDADFVVVDLHKPNTIPSYEPISSLVYSGSPANIYAVAICGKFVFEDGRFTTVNEEDLLQRAERKAIQLHDRAMRDAP